MTGIILVCILFLIFGKFLYIFCDPPPGHLKPIGHHRKPVGGVTILDDFPSPVDFYENYLTKSQPFVVKGILEKGEFPAYKLWTDKYLSDKYGSINVDVEGGKKEDRGANQYVMPMSKFLQIYNQSNIYMVHDVAKEMNDDVTIPISIQCGGMQNVIRSVIVWFSSGGTKSVLHNDGLDNFNCLLDGRKDLVMFHKKYKKEIEADHFIKRGAYSMVDVEAVDMEKFPKLADLPWYMVNMTKGDCLYIPFQWYHHVYSHPGRNLAVNVWSHHLRWFNKTECQALEKSLKPKALKYFEYTEDQGIRELFMDIIFDEMDNISRTEFFNEMKKYLIPDVDGEIIMVIFELIDQDKDDNLTLYELHVCNYQAMLEELPDFEALFDMSKYQSPDDTPKQYKEPEFIDVNDDVTFLMNPPNQVDNRRGSDKDEL